MSADEKRNLPFWVIDPSDMFNASGKKNLEQTDIKNRIHEKVILFNFILQYLAVQS